MCLYINKYIYGFTVQFEGLHLEGARCEWNDELGGSVIHFTFYGKPEKNVSFLICKYMVTDFKKRDHIEGKRDQVSFDMKKLTKEQRKDKSVTKYTGKSKFGK